jgi:hypothetical protein
MQVLFSRALMEKTGQATLALQHGNAPDYLSEFAFWVRVLYRTISFVSKN